MSKKPGLTLDEQEKVKMLVAMGKTYHAVAKEIGRMKKQLRNARQHPTPLLRSLKRNVSLLTGMKT
jgi:hypothetical protein